MRNTSLFRPEGVKWCHHGLIVKFVGNKDSKHYKKKYEVRKSVARDEIHARSLLTDKISEFDERDFGEFSSLYPPLPSFSVETVIPKKTGSVMMVIAGSMKGEFGKISELARAWDSTIRKEVLESASAALSGAPRPVV